MPLAADGWEVVEGVVSPGKRARLWLELTADPGLQPGAEPPVIPATPWTCSAPPARWLRKRVHKAAAACFRVPYAGLCFEMLPGYLSTTYRTDPRAEQPTTMSGSADAMVLGWTNLGDADDEVVLVADSARAGEVGGHRRRLSVETADTLLTVRVPPGAHLFYDSRLLIGDRPGPKQRAGTAFRITAGSDPLFGASFPVLKTGFAVPPSSNGRAAVEGYAPTVSAVFAEPHRYVLPLPNGMVQHTAIGKVAYQQSPTRAYRSIQTLFRPALFGFDMWPDYPPPFNDFYFYPELNAEVYRDLVPPYTLEERTLHLPTRLPSARPSGILF